MADRRRDDFPNNFVGDLVKTGRGWVVVPWTCCPDGHDYNEPGWYLAVIGSDTLARGKGYGQALMQSRLDRVDAEHAPAYLESSNAENVPYYQRSGFEVTGEIVIPEGGPTLWPMWRPPR